jgi:hypothetical protein
LIEVPAVAEREPQPEEGEIAHVIPSPLPSALIDAETAVSVLFATCCADVGDVMNTAVGVIPMPVEAYCVLSATETALTVAVQAEEIELAV